MPTVRVVADTPLPPDRVLAAAHDFSPRRAETFPAVSVKRMTVHELADSSADVTEGTRAGPIVNWERCRYDWSRPGSVLATVIDSNVYAFPGSSWEIKAAPKSGGSEVEMIWAREFQRGPRGRLFGALFGRIGDRVFDKYARDTLANLEKLEGLSPPTEPRPTART
jgi:Polyketide cyclase / dehydrase and lipid transport